MYPTQCLIRYGCRVFVPAAAPLSVYKVNAMDLYGEAIRRFQDLFTRAQTLDINEPAAMSLATVNAEGRPTVRTVLLRGADERGFVFYTNKRSRKGHDISAHPHVALCLFWQPLMEQVMIEGVAQGVDDAEADAYWATRPRASQVGGWASEQSEPLDSREALVARVQAFDKRFGGGLVPRPAHWGGYRVVPDMIEFWNSRAGRLHERDRYFHDAHGWHHTLLNP